MNRRLALMAMLLLAVLALAGCGQSAGKLNNEGNEAFAEQDYEGALVAYQQAQEEAPQMAEPRYNAANTHYRIEDYEQAQQEIEQALVGESQEESLDQNSYYNLGNVLFQGGQFAAAIEAYKEALRLNPGDLQAKQNLELALRQLQEQEQQEEQQQDEQQQDSQQDEQQQDGQQDEPQQDEQRQDGQQDEARQDQAQQDGQQDEARQDQAQQDRQQDEARQDQAQQDEPQQDGQAGGQPRQITGLSEEQARRLFEAAAQGAESLEEFLQQILVFPGAPPREDW